MKEEWKKIFLQLLAPFVVTFIALLFLYIQFVSDIKTDAAELNEKNMITVAQKYGAKLEQKFYEAYSVGSVAVQAISSSNNREDTERILKSVVQGSEFSAAMIGYQNGNAYTYKGEMIAISQYGYYDECKTVEGYHYQYVENMGYMDEGALLLTMAIPDSENKLLLFYPIKTVRTMLKVEQEFDQASFTALLDDAGNILSSTEAGSGFFGKNNFWESVDTGYEKEIGRVQQSVRIGQPGCVHLEAGLDNRTIAYCPIGNNCWSVVIGVNQRYVNIAQKQLYNRAYKGINQMLILVIVAIVIVLVINICSRITGIKSSNELKEKADTDLLTGLGNKLATERKIKEYMAESPNSLAMMFVLDIDNFKKINDTMGHAFGDEVLRELGRQIGINFRVTDIIGRTGGDEFTIFLKNLKDDSNTLREAQKLVYFFRHFQVGDYVKYSATASIGAAIFPNDGNDFDTLYKSADAALYKAKKRGKNQLAFFDDRDRK